MALAQNRGRILFSAVFSASEYISALSPVLYEFQSDIRLYDKADEKPLQNYNGFSVYRQCPSEGHLTEIFN